MTDVSARQHDLWYDATTVGADLVVETWISHGPRRDDPTFNPQPGTSCSSATTKNPRSKDASSAATTIASGSKSTSTPPSPDSRTAANGYARATEASPRDHAKWLTRSATPDVSWHQHLRTARC